VKHRATFRLAGLCSILLLGCLADIRGASGPSNPRAEPVPGYGKLPLSFEINEGQADPQVRFISRGAGYSLYLTGTEAVLALRKPAGAREGKLNEHTPHRTQSSLVRMQLSGGNTDIKVSGEEKLPGTVNYFIGNDPKRWRVGLPTYRKVRYSGVYPGVDLVYYGSQHELEYDFLVMPHGNPQEIRLHFAGSKTVRLDTGGNLAISAEAGDIVFEKPVIYQDKRGHRTQVKGTFQLLAGNEVGFRLGTYDHNQTLVIDPKLEYSTFFGGNAEAEPAALAVDSTGAVYLTGTVYDGGLPVSPGAVQGKWAGNADDNDNSNAFVTKLNATGTALVYETYLGGSGGYDSAAASEEGDMGLCIAVDRSGNAYVGGETDSADFPLKDAYQNVYRGAANQVTNGFLTKLNPTGTALVYSTYFGGSGVSGNGGDGISGVAVNSSGDALVTGLTYSNSDFPHTSGAYQSSNRAASAGLSNAFIAKFEPAGTGLLYSTFLGGSGNTAAPSPGIGDSAVAIALDASGNAYVTGLAGSLDFPLAGAYLQGSNHAADNNGTNAFVTEINAAGGKLIYSTYLGGSGSTTTLFPGDYGESIAVGPSGDIYVAGLTDSTDFPEISAGAVQTSNADATYSCGFVARIDPTKKDPSYATYLCGPSSAAYFAFLDPIGTISAGIRVDSAGNAYVAGVTNDSEFPITANAFQSTNNGTELQVTNGFLTVLSPTLSSLIYSTYFGGSGYTDCADPYCITVGDTAAAVALDSSDNIYVAGVAASGDFPILKGAYQATKTSIDVGYVAKFNLSASGSTVETAITLASSANPSDVGDAVTFTAHIVPRTGKAEPTGTVDFSVDGGAMTSVALNGSGYAAYTDKSLARGSHSILAAYSGDADNTASSAYLTQTVTTPAATSVFKPAGGTFTSSVSVSITDSTSGAMIYYTTNGSTPTTGSTKYTEPITVKTTATIKAIAVSSGYTNSAVASATYTIK